MHAGACRQRSLRANPVGRDHLLREILRGQLRTVVAGVAAHELPLAVEDLESRPGRDRRDIQEVVDDGAGRRVLAGGSSAGSGVSVLRSRRTRIAGAGVNR